MVRRSISEAALVLALLSLSAIIDLRILHESVFSTTLSPSNMPLMKGMTVNAWGPENYSSPDFDQSITNLANMKASWVLYTVFWFMDTPTSTEIRRRPDKYTASDSSLFHAVQKAYELGMSVALKPMVDVSDGSWRGLISPSNWTMWFKNYRSFMNYYANFSEVSNVGLLVVGTELRSSQVYESEWREVINQARIHFSGNITYAANWDSYRTDSVKFWDTLDYVGVDAYFPLTNSYTPTVEQLEGAWSYCTRSGYLSRNWTNELYSTFTTTGKEIVFTEIGYYSQDGVNTQPWTGFSPPHQIDLQEQADCYQAALEVFKSKTWFKGWFWWNWETSPNAGGPNDDWYPLQNKPAQNVVNQYYYEVPPDVAVINVTSSEAVVEKGELVTINVTVENQGIYPETFNVTAYANVTAIQTQILIITNGTSTETTFIWNTSSFNKGNYSISAYASPLTFETDKADNTFTDGWILIATLHDVAITSVTPSKTVVGQTYPLNINITVENQGYLPETLNITVYANKTQIITQTCNLTGWNSTTIIFTWNTTETAKSNYTLSAYVLPVPGETNTENNNATDGLIYVGTPGDINADGKINMADIGYVARRFLIDSTNPLWDPNADINSDGKIDMADVGIAARRFGET